MIEAHGRDRAEWKGTKRKGENTISRVEVRARSRGRGEGHMEMNKLKHSNKRKGKAGMKQERNILTHN